MNGVDLIVLIIVGISVLISVVRGIVRELMYLLGWVVAFVMSFTLGPTVGAWLLPEVIADPLIRTMAGYVLTFLVTLVLMAVLGGMISRLIHKVGLGLADRLLGAAYGLARGVLIVMLLTLFVGFTRVPGTPIWRTSFVAPWLEMAALSLQPYLPASISERINYAAGFTGRHQERHADAQSSSASLSCCHA
jgi:membrane protein required for colicin V production